MSKNYGLMLNDELIRAVRSLRDIVAGGQAGEDFTNYRMRVSACEAELAKTAPVLADRVDNLQKAIKMMAEIVNNMRDED